MEFPGNLSWTLALTEMLMMTASLIKGASTQITRGRVIDPSSGGGWLTKRGRSDGSSDRMGFHEHPLVSQVDNAKDTHQGNILNNF